LANVIILNGGGESPEYYPRVQRSLGAYRVANSIKNNGYTVAVVDFIQYLTTEEIIQALSKHLSEETIWVGYSSTFFYLNKPAANGIDRMYQNISYDKISAIYAHIKNNSNAKIVFGGARALQAHSDPLVDYYIAGYADNSSVDLTNFLSGKSLSLHHSQVIDIEGSNRTLIDSGKYEEPSMSSLITNWEDDNFYLLPNEAVPIEFARGCIFKCKFCSYPLLGKKKGTYIREMSQVKDEIVKLWETTGTDTFYITDDTFNDDNDKMENFHKLFTSLPFKPKFSAFLRLDLLDRFPHQADLLLEAGLIGNFFGIESLNWKSAKAIGKGLHPDKIKNRLQWVRDKWKGKVNIAAGFIIGLPYDTPEYFKELHDYVFSKDYPIQHTVFNPLSIFDKSRGVNLYGSEFSMNAGVYGYKFDQDGLWYHEEQKFNFNDCRTIANEFNSNANKQNMVSEFQMMTYLNLGVDLQDMLKYNQVQLDSMYNIPGMNEYRLNQYKTMIGVL
jgi:radical SAM superfamily enzyme YgiQ (UPF0313 family)